LYGRQLISKTTYKIYLSFPKSRTFKQLMMVVDTHNVGRYLEDKLIEKI